MLPLGSKQTLHQRGVISQATWEGLQAMYCEISCTCIKNSRMCDVYLSTNIWVSQMSDSSFLL